MSANKMAAISADSNMGRTLLALRAGPMTTGELSDRFPGGHHVHQLSQFGMVKRADDRWVITEAGRAACPLRNPLAAGISDVPKGARAARSTVFQQGRYPSATKGVEFMHKPETSISRVRALLQESPNGISRKDLIQRTGLTATRVDNAIFNLIRLGEATRPAYGVISLSTGEKTPKATTPPDARPVAPLIPPNEAFDVKAGKAAPESLPLADEGNEAVDFSIHADGQLTIATAFDGTVVLPASETLRLQSFLSHINLAVLQPQPN